MSVSMPKPRPRGGDGWLPPAAAGAARHILLAFLATFLLARIVVLLIMSRRVPDLYLHLGGSHVYHLNYGIFILSAVGAYLLIARPVGRQLAASATAYGVGLALTFDEFGMWAHLGGGYWQRASLDAVAVVAAVLGLVAVAPSVRRLRARSWLAVGLRAVGVATFAALLVESLSHAESRWQPA